MIRTYYLPDKLAYITYGLTAQLRSICPQIPRFWFPIARVLYRLLFHTAWYASSYLSQNNSVVGSVDRKPLSTWDRKANRQMQKWLERSKKNNLCTKTTEISWENDCTCMPWAHTVYDLQIWGWWPPQCNVSVRLEYPLYDNLEHRVCSTPGCKQYLLWYSAEPGRADTWSNDWVWEEGRSCGAQLQTMRRSPNWFQPWWDSAYYAASVTLGITSKTYFLNVDLAFHYLFLILKTLLFK